MDITIDAVLKHWTFYFSDSQLPLSCIGTWSGSMQKVNIALQELQAVALILHNMALQLSSKVVVLHLDDSTAKTYLCNQGNTASTLLSKLA